MAGEYVNPVSLAQMQPQGQAPDFMFPGFGINEGWQRGQNQSAAQQFLNLSLAQQADDLVRKQYENAEYASAPFQIARQNEATGKGQQALNQAYLTAQQGDETAQKVRGMNFENNANDMAVAAGFHGQFDQSKGQIYNDNVLSNYRRTYKAATGKDADPFFDTYRPGETEGAFKAAAEQTNADTLRRQQLMRTEGNIKTGQIQTQMDLERRNQQDRLETEKQIARWHNQTQIDIADMNTRKSAAGLMHGALTAQASFHEHGGVNFPPAKETYERDMAAFNQLTGSEQAYLRHMEEIMRNPMLIQAAQAFYKATGIGMTMQALGGQQPAQSDISKMLPPNTGTNMGTATPSASPQGTGPADPGLMDELRKNGIPYEPDKYYYEQRDGKWGFRPK